MKPALPASVTDEGLDHPLVQILGGESTLCEPSPEGARGPPEGLYGRRGIASRDEGLGDRVEDQSDGTILLWSSRLECPGGLLQHLSSNVDLFATKAGARNGVLHTYRRHEADGRSPRWQGALVAVEGVGGSQLMAGVLLSQHALYERRLTEPLLLTCRRTGVPPDSPTSLLISLQAFTKTLT